MQKNRWVNFFGKARILIVLTLLLSTSFAFGQPPPGAIEIKVPGTGRNIAVGEPEPIYNVYGVWRLTANDPEPQTVSADVKRYATDIAACLASGDHTIEIEELGNVPQGGADISCVYEFTVLQDGDYYINCYVQGADHGVDIAKYVGHPTGDINGYLGIVSDNTPSGPCSEYNLSTHLLAGTYLFRVNAALSAEPARITVTSATGGDEGTCVPALKMSNSSSVTIASGATATLPLTSTPSSASASYTWITAGNPNTSGVQNNVLHTTSTLTETITNLTGVQQTVTYTVTPKPSGNVCKGVPQIVNVIVNPSCRVAAIGFEPKDCPDGIGGLSFFCTTPNLVQSDRSDWDFGDGTTLMNINPNGAKFHNYASEGEYTVTLTLRLSDGCPPTTVTKKIYYYNPVITFTASSYITSPGQTVLLNFSTFYPSNTQFTFNLTLLQNGVPVSGFPTTSTPGPRTYSWIAPSAPGTYTLLLKAVRPWNDISCTIQKTITIKVIDCETGDCDPIECNDCIGSFAPVPNNEYTISAWVQESNSTQKVNFDGASIQLDFGSSITLKPTFATSGLIIDGWQRIDGTFLVPDNAGIVYVKLRNGGPNDVYFDDLRIHPVKASLKSFVYDPVSMRLMAELDENNYATFYEYDEEGALIRVKKETERGVKTIKETGNNTRKKQ